MTLTHEVRETMTATARQAVAYVTRRARWIDAAEVTQEVWAAMLAALPTFDPTQGSPLGAYLYRAAVRAGHTLVYSLAAPAHVPVMARTTHRVSKAIASRSTDVELHGQAADDVPVDEILDRVTRAERLANIVAAKLAKNQLGAAIEAVFRGEVTPQDAAEAMGVTARQMHTALYYAKQRIRADPRVQELA